MTINTQYTPDSYSGDGSTTSFAITFNFLSTASYIKVSIKDTNGTITEQTQGNQYNVSGSNVVFETVNTPAATDTVIIELNPPHTQTSDYTENTAFPAETLEDNLDLLTLESQLNNEQFGRAFTLDASVDTSSLSLVFPDAEASKYIRWNAAANALEAADGTVTPVAGLVVDDTSPQLGGNLDTNSFNIFFDTAHGIADDSGNEQIFFTKTTSAVNYINVTNAATTNGPTMDVAGGDTNIDFNIATKGTGNIKLNDDTDVTGNATVSGTLDVTGTTTLGVVTVGSTLAVTGNTTLDGTLSADVTLTVDGDATSPGEIRMAEDTDNGTNYMGFKAPAAVTASLSLELPDGDGTSGQALTTNGSGVLSFSDAGKIVQLVRASESTGASTTTIMNFDNTIPQNTEGVEFETLAITPTNSSNILVIDFHAWLSHSALGGDVMCALFQDSTADALAATVSDTGQGFQNVLVRHYMTAGTTSETTFKIRFGPSVAGTAYIIRSSGSQIWSTVGKSEFFIYELSA